MMGLGVFARAPVPGATKTRLARALGEGGDEAAARLHRAFLRDLLERDLKEFLEEGSANGFGQLQSTVTLITQVTKEFFEKLAGELELGLAGLTDRYTNSLP